MSKSIEEAIMERINGPGWVTTRGVLKDPSGQSKEEDYTMVEEAMKRLAEKGLVTLWVLKLEYEAAELLAAARPDLELDKDLEQRGAAAKAERYSVAD
ncbi:MAG: hypothetical protein ACLP5H_14860 [Desulfomonilaceae bacterium]